MGDEEYVLLVGVHAGRRDALADLREVTAAGPVGEAVAGAAVLHRGLDRSTLQQGGGGTLAYGIGTGAAAGVVAGVELTAPLAGAAAGAAIGAAVGHRLSRREVDDLAAALDDAVPVGASAVLAVVRADRLDLVRGALRHSLRATARLLEDDPLRRLARSLVRGNPTATEALGGRSS